MRRNSANFCRVSIKWCYLNNTLLELPPRSQADLNPEMGNRCDVFSFERDFHKLSIVCSDTCYAGVISPSRKAREKWAELAFPLSIIRCYLIGQHSVKWRDKLTRPRDNCMSYGYKHLFVLDSGIFSGVRNQIN